jgi:flagellar hook assembly protein FlgD
LQINYQFEKNGLIATVSIYDDSGREIKRLISSELLGTSGFTAWDGTQENGVKASIGNYIVLFEAFSIDGTLNFTTTKAVTLAGKL